MAANKKAAKKKAKRGRPTKYNNAILAKANGCDDDELYVYLDKVNFDPASEDDQGSLDDLDPKYINCTCCGKEFYMRKCK